MKYDHNERLKRKKLITVSRKFDYDKLRHEDEVKYFQFNHEKRFNKFCRESDEKWKPRK